MSTKRFSLFVAIIVIASLALTACGAGAATPQSQTPQDICGEAGVWYTEPVEGGTKVYCNTGPGTEDPAATEAPVAEAPAQPETCKAINDYQLKDLTEISSQPSSLIHVEWYTADGQPEYESVLPSGRYTVDKPFPGGHVWEMSTSCTPNQVLSDHVAPHIARRLQNLANNKGYRPWEDLVEMGFISQITSTSSVVVPNVLP